jgi:poly-gamma-glutamate synthesis protein (capsule biosynthesis protein)
VILGAVLWMSSACAPQPAARIVADSPTAALPPSSAPTATPFPVSTTTPTTDPGFHLWISPAVPTALREGLNLPSQISLADYSSDNAFRLEPASSADAGQALVASAEWVYVLVAPFPTVQDGVTASELLDDWGGKPGSAFAGHRILVDASTKAAIESRFGPASGNTVQVIPQEQILETAWSDLSSWAIVPFESLVPRWKVLQIDGLSPYQRSFDPAAYPLTIHFNLVGPQNRVDAFRSITGAGQPLGIALTNRDPEKLTVLVMTGVTAMVRATANKMDVKGVTYPGRDIRDWLRDADITHISNEIPFDPRCPTGNPNQDTLQFCSRPEYIGLLDDIGADVIELTGNHLNDYSRQGLLYTLDLYDQRHMQYYGGGRNIEAARKPLLIEDHGNKLAFIGCNAPGPEFDWATEKGAGSAACDDYAWEIQAIQDVRAQGYLPIATFQYNESYGFTPGIRQIRDFQKISAAGAVIVGGSQAHFPQTFEFNAEGMVIHYGLGNLFFDQMAPLIDGRKIYGTEREFIDRHVFYDGRYLGMDVLTAMLEDYAKPRPMTALERQALLTDVFAASGW